MDYTAVVDRLRQECPAYRLVDFAASFEALKERGLPALPAAFVLPAKESGSRNKNAGGVHNAVRFRFRVFTMCKFAGDQLGGKALDILAPLRTQVRAALLAWRLPVPPDPAPGELISKPDSAVEFGEADFVQFADGILVFYDQFEFDGYYRRVT